MVTTVEADAALLRDLIDRRPELNACALRPGQAVHVHALERLLDRDHGRPAVEAMCINHDRDTLLAELAALRTWDEELADAENEVERPPPVNTLDELIRRARHLFPSEDTR
jgi:hypothetical protein